jgi:hypothetical protein
VPVDDHGAHAAPAELIGEHQPGWAGSSDEDLGIHKIKFQEIGIGLP